MGYIKTLLSAAYNLTHAQRKWVVRVGIVCGTVLVLLVLLGALNTAVMMVPAESPLWEAALQLRLVLVRLVVAPAIALVAVATALGIYLVLRMTEMARRLMTWAEGDTAVVKAEKTRNAGNLLAALLVSVVLGMLIGVLR